MAKTHFIPSVSPMAVPHTLNPHIGKPFLGSVGYLNMLPFFWQKVLLESDGRTLFSHGENDSNLVFSTPRALNERARQGELSAACMSTIAGLKAGYKTLEPGFGISTSAKVFSVFLEPLFPNSSEQSNAAQKMWACLWENNFNLLGQVMKEFGHKEHLNKESFIKFLLSKDFDEVEFLRSLAPVNAANTVCLVSSGASEHSEWMARVLLRCQGFDVRVVYEPSLSSLPRFELLKLTKGLPSAILSIGDEALLRQIKDPEAYRLDLGEMWQNFSGLPPVFATWFESPNTVPLASEGLQDVVSMISNSLLAWNKLTVAEKSRIVQGFLNQGSRSALLRMGVEQVTGVERAHAVKNAPHENIEYPVTSLPSVLDYIANITYEFGEDQRQTIEVYKKLLQMQII